jgi:hypothetical protein
MTNIRDIAPKPQEPATRAGQFLIKRGHVVLKEFRDIGSFKCDHGTKLSVQTLIFAIASGGSGDRTFGIKLEHANPNKYDESCLIDFDELKELLIAIKYLLQLAQEKQGTRCDYTEYQYVSKDSFTVGFFQENSGRQQVFVDVSPGGGMMFISFDHLRKLFELIKAGREHLISKGAGTEATVTSVTG